MATLTATDEKPDPPDADFAIVIDFRKGEGSPTRVFSAVAEFIHAFEALDRMLVQSVDSNIESVMVLEDVEAGSLKIWLRNALRAADDQALKDMDWKPAVGKYLVRAKYIFLSWIEKDDAPKSLQDLRRDVHKLASETDVRHLPDYAPPDPAGLIDAAIKIQSAKDMLDPDDKVSFEHKDGSLEIDISVRLDPDQLADLATRETITMPPAPMILAVKKPDYLGISKWELRHGRRTISARIEDRSFLSDFQGRKIDVRPGDALRCKVSVVMKYGFDNELISESYVVTEVVEVLEDTYEQGDLFGDDAKGSPKEG